MWLHPTVQHCKKPIGNSFIFLLQLSAYSEGALEAALEFDPTNFSEDIKRQLKEVKTTTFFELLSFQK